MNIVWIEDFDKLDSGTATLSLIFQDLLSFESRDEDELSLLNKPSDLENFVKKIRLYTALFMPPLFLLC
jgi:hypothetical protein